MTAPEPFVIGRTKWMRKTIARPNGHMGGGGYSSRPSRMAGNVRGVPQIVFKVARNGGCHGPRGLATQMDYVLGKAEHIIDPNKQIDRMNHLPKEFSKALADDWADGWNRKVASGNSLHMIASFPRFTHPEAVAEIIRDTCQDILDQGRGRFNYVAAVHTDRDHPHAHIIVDRRNADGEFFYFARDHEFTYDIFKDCIVDHAATLGIELVNSSRLSRGLIDRPEPNAREALRGLTGELVACGAAPYQNKPKERQSYFVTVRTPTGEKTLWGKELRFAIEAVAPRPGEMLKITHEGKESIQITTKDGQTIQAHRNRWSVTTPDREKGREDILPPAGRVPGAEPTSEEVKNLEARRQRVLDYAKEYRAMSAGLVAEYPALARGFAKAAEVLEKGRALTDQFRLTSIGDRRMSEIQQMRDEHDHLVQSIERARNDLRDIREAIEDLPGSERPGFEAMYFKALKDLQEVGRDHSDSALSEPAHGTIYEKEVREQLQNHQPEQLAKALMGTGIDPEELAARLKIQSTSAALEAHWVEKDAWDVAEARGYSMTTDEGRQQAFRDVAETYKGLSLGLERGRDEEVAGSFDDRDLVTVIEDRQTMINEVKDLARHDTLTAEQQRRLTAILDQTLGREAAQELKAGNTDVLRDFGSRVDQIDLAEKYLKAEQSQGADRTAALHVVAKDRELHQMDQQAKRSQELDIAEAQHRQRNRDNGIDR